MNITPISLPIFEMIYILVSIACLVLLAHILGNLFCKFHMPRVIGEILSGILLGPSLLGELAPEIYSYILCSTEAQPKILGLFYWIGLIMLMISAGFKFNPIPLNKKSRKVVIALLLGSTILPIIGGYSYYHVYDFSMYKGLNGTDFSLWLIIAVSIAITSIPVISKIFIDLNIANTKFAQIILTTAIIHDLFLWIVLDVAIKESSAGQNSATLTTFVTIVFLLISILISRFAVSMENITSLLSFSSVPAISLNLCASLILVILVHFLHIHIIFGALVSGIIIGSIKNNDLSHGREKICDFSLAFFIPLYFAIVGLKINLSSHFNMQLFLGFFVISSMLEIGSVFLSMKVLGKTFLASVNFGVAMNTRGGPGIVIASVALEHKIISEELFVALILTAITTSLMTGAWFKWVIHRKFELYDEMLST